MFKEWCATLTLQDYMFNHTVIISEILIITNEIKYLNFLVQYKVMVIIVN